MRPVTYIYFNNPEIISLYAQLVGWVPTDRSKGSRKTIKGSLSARIFGAGADAGVAKESTNQERAELSVENKLRELLARLNGEELLLHQLSDALAMVFGSKTGVYVDIEQRFDAPQFREMEAHANVIQNLNQAGSILLECAVDDKCILLSMELDHMPRVHNGKMSATGHDAILFREFKGSAIPLRVFGYLHVAGQNIQIRPITVELV